MKPNVKIGSFLMTVVMIFSVLIVSGCTPMSLNKEWSYKSGDKELAIGVYIYSLDTAYQQAKSYAQKLDDYDESKDSWLEMEITDDDGKKEVASKWIKDQAKLMCLSYLVLDEQIEKENIDVSLASADEQAETYWNVGQYADYGYIMPMKDDLEPYGISLESFRYCSTEYSVKYQALFDKLYKEGGSKEVSDEELTKYFNENYTDYSYFTVNLYTASTDEAGQSTNVAMSDEEAKKVTDEIDGYVKDINNGKSYDDVLEAYMKANDIESDPATSNIENLENSSLGDEVKEALEKLDNKKATAVKVGSGENAVYYFIYKRNIKDAAKDYVADETKKANLISSMKGEEFADYIEELTTKLDYEENTSAIDKYEPKMFFIPVEPTTAAETSATSEE
ncbi:hypothetical protein [Ruminococcus sp.]|uniref:hypothetical protein n=1 Tax=Ruminococcus sp. TaxID=41978 RepID=UPI003EFE1465